VSTEFQLDFTGREVSIEASMSYWHPRETQRLLLRLARRPEGVTALQAGNALHAARMSLTHRPCTAHGAKGFGPTKRGGCCPYASSDGSAALKRLAERGVVTQRRPRGPYFAVLND
jgi:hypothetical protein